MTWEIPLFAAKAGEVLLVNGDSGGGARGRTGTVTTAGTVATAATGSATTGTTAAATATGSATAGAGGLDKAQVDIEEGLLLALLFAAGLLLLALEVLLLLLAALDLLGAGPLLVELAALVGGTDGLGAEVTLSGLLGQVVGQRHGLLSGLLGLAGGLRLGLLGVGDLLAGLLVGQLLLAALATPALGDLLAGTARFQVSGSGRS